MITIRKSEFIIFDVETTGLSPTFGDRVIEIAALKIKNLKPMDEFHSFVDPQRKISWGAFLVNGISQEMLEGAPKAREVLPKFMEFLGEGYLIGHNVGFDLGFLTNELTLIRYPLEKEFMALDTVKMARMFLPGLRRYPLWFVARSLGIDRIQQHRAMSDVRLTFEVFCRLIEIAERNDIHDLSTLTKWCGRKSRTEKNYFNRCGG